MSPTTISILQSLTAISPLPGASTPGASGPFFDFNFPDSDPIISGNTAGSPGWAHIAKSFDLRIDTLSSPTAAAHTPNVRVDRNSAGLHHSRPIVNLNFDEISRAHEEETSEEHLGSYEGDDDDDCGSDSWGQEEYAIDDFETLNSGRGNDSAVVEDCVDHVAAESNSTDELYEPDTLRERKSMRRKSAHSRSNAKSSVRSGHGQAPPTKVKRARAISAPLYASTSIQDGAVSMLPPLTRQHLETAAVTAARVYPYRRTQSHPVPLSLSDYDPSNLGVLTSLIDTPNLPAALSSQKKTTTIQQGNGSLPPKRKYQKRRVCEMTPEQLKDTREKNKIMSRRNRLRQKLRFQAIKAHINQLDRNNAALRKEAEAQRNVLVQLRKRVMASPHLLGKIMSINPNHGSSVNNRNIVNTNSGMSRSMAVSAY